jgi:DNA-binding phage protein
MTDEKAIMKPASVLVREKDLANYWLSAAVSAEKMLQSVLNDCDDAEMSSQLRVVESYIRVREKIGSMVEKSVSYSESDGGWDPFASDPLEKKIDESQARSRFDGVSSTTIDLGVAKTKGDNGPAEQDAVKLYKSGLGMMKISDSTGLSTKQIRKALRVAGVERRKRKKVDTIPEKVVVIE